MYRQQKNQFESQDCRESIPDSIVSISKPYVRPIVRGKRLIHCTTLHKRLFGVDVKKIVGDTGYAGIENRDFCKDTVRQELARVRATAMEGSFGTQKEHYDLRRVQWLFPSNKFGSNKNYD